MKRVNVLYIEKTDFSEEALTDYKMFISSIFNMLKYTVEIDLYLDTPDRNRIGEIIDKKSIDVIFCDLTLGSTMSENLLGLENIKYLKLNYPEIVICGISGANISYRQTSIQKNLPTFDLFIDKSMHDDDDYKEYIKSEMSRIFCSNVGIEINSDNLKNKSEKAFVNTPIFKRLLKKITFTTHEDIDGTNVKKIILHPTKGGYSQSYVFKMICLTENGETVINSVLKCSEKDYALKEINNYLNYVKWYLPYTWRPEMLSYAFSQEYGMICYSFAYNDDKPFTSLSDKIHSADYLKVDLAIEQIFGGSHKQWYGEGNRNSVRNSINKYYTKLYFPNKDRRKPYDIVENLVKEIGGAVSHDDQYLIEGKYYPSAHKLFVHTVSNHYKECLCHGDLNTNNIQISEDNELIFIDFQDTGKGHVFHDFIVFEMCLRLYSKFQTEDFQTILKNEISISNEDYTFAKDESIWPRVQKVRSLSKDNFPEENFETYYFGMAMRAFRLLRVYRKDKNQSLLKWETKILLAVLLANLLKLN